MADETTPEPDDVSDADADVPASEAAPAARGSVRASHTGAGPLGRRGLDRRTLAISFCLALACGLVAALVATIVLRDDGSSSAADNGSDDSITLSAPTDIDSGRLLSASLTTVDGEATSLREQLDGRPTLVNLWSKTCIPCITEMPLLETSSQNNPDLAYLGVNVNDRSVDEARDMAAQTGITYPWVRDDGGAFLSAADATGLPITLLLSPDGTVLASELGQFNSQDEIQAFIDENL